MAEIGEGKILLNEEHLAELAASQLQNGDLSQEQLDRLASHLVALADNPDHQLDAIEHSLTKVYHVTDDDLAQVPPPLLMAPAAPVISNVVIEGIFFVFLFFRRLR